MAANLEACVSEVLGQARKIAGVIVNGDCAHISGLQADYETLRPLLQPLTEAQIPVHLLMGNHDDRVTFAAAMGRAAATVVESRFVAVQESPLVNWFLLDSLDEVNVTPGRLGEVQLAWLAKELDARTDKPAIVVVHHNIVKEPQITALQDSAALLALVRPRRQVKACFFGHIHHWEQTVDESGLHVVSLPPTSYVFRPESPNGWVRAVPRRDGMDLELRCLNVRHPQHGEVKKLAWRV
jgi:3',5'-cyclic AMP phosphodiesterase CpdA